MNRLLVVLFAAITAIGLAGQHGADDARQAQSNLKQITLGTIMYSADFDDRMPANVNQVGAIYPYLRSTSLFLPFPTEKPAVTYKFKMSGAKGATIKSAYVFNTALAGIELTKIKFPADTVLWSYGSRKHLSFAFDGKTLIGFADGHTKLVDKAAAKKLRWQP